MYRRKTKILYKKINKKINNFHNFSKMFIPQLKILIILEFRKIVEFKTFTVLNSILYLNLFAQIAFYLLFDKFDKFFVKFL
jgi:hypothetical protein